MKPPTKAEALALLADESYEPESYGEAAEVFAALYGRAPDSEDGDQCAVWSLCCAYSDEVSEEP